MKIPNSTAGAFAALILQGALTPAQAKKMYLAAHFRLLSPPAEGTRPATARATPSKTTKESKQ